MGWTSLHREAGMTDRAFFEQEFPTTLTRDGEILDCATVQGVFYAAVRNKKTNDVDQEGTVWALVVLTQRAGGHYNYSYKEMSDSSGPTEARCPARILDLLTPLPECSHEQEYCKLCGREITPDADRWVSHARPGQRTEVAGPRCWSGYPHGAKADDGGAPFHQPGGTAPCSTCWAREWRRRCRVNAERDARARARARKVRPGTRVRFDRLLRFEDDAWLHTFVFVRHSTFRDPDSGRLYRIPRWRTAYEYEVVEATEV
jgi:hypothetical protein